MDCQCIRTFWNYSFLISLFWRGYSDLDSYSADWYDQPAYVHSHGNDDRSCEDCYR